MFYHALQMGKTTRNAGKRLEKSHLVLAIAIGPSSWKCFEIVCFKRALTHFPLYMSPHYHAACCHLSSSDEEMGWLGTVDVGENFIKSLTSDRGHTDLYEGLFPVHDGESRLSSFRPTNDRFEDPLSSEKILKPLSNLPTFRRFLTHVIRSEIHGQQIIMHSDGVAICLASEILHPDLFLKQSVDVGRPRRRPVPSPPYSRSETRDLNYIFMRR